MTGTTQTDPKVLLKAEGMRKEFGITQAIKDVDLTIYAGEVRTLIGENGSGKSTLSNMFAGVHFMTAGKMTFKGQPYTPANVIDARAKGIGLVAQEVGTIDNLTVAENMFMGRETMFRKAGMVDRKAMVEATNKALDAVGITGFRGDDDINVLSFEDRKLVEVIMVLDANPDIIIFDETTTALSKRGRELLYKVMRDQRDKGKSIIFISHDLDEVKEVSDRVTVMRDGDLITTLDDPAQITVDNMRQLMIGRDFTDGYYREDYDSSCGEPVLSIEHLTQKGVFEDISFDVHAGEIVGIGGLTECGMHELCKAIYGIGSVDGGSITELRSGKKILSTQDALSVHMGYMSKNREVEGMMPSASIRENVMLMAYDKAKIGKLYISPRKEKQLTEKLHEELSIKCENIEQWTSNLSGGNKQKVVIAKWLANDSQIIIMDCPTRGIDIGVKAAIYRLMEQLKAEGRSIIMISEEMPEVIGMSDRIYVMKDGRITKVFRREDHVTESDIIQYMV